MYLKNHLSACIELYEEVLTQYLKHKSPGGDTSDKILTCYKKLCGTIREKRIMENLGFQDSDRDSFNMQANYIGNKFKKHLNSDKKINFQEFIS